MKLDLGEIELKATAATPGPWRCERKAAVYCDRGRDWCDPEVARTRTYPEDDKTVISAHFMTVGKLEREIDNAMYIAAVHPDVTLALIARIRELEAALADVAHRAGRVDLCDSIDHGSVAGLIEKGVVLP